MERALYEHEVLNDRNWGNHDDGIDNLFKVWPAKRSDDRFIITETNIGHNEFMGIITEYPKNIILHNGLSRGRKDRPETICDTSRVPLLSNDRVYAPGVRLSNTVNRWYDSWGKFLADFGPQIRVSANNGNLRAKIILWGIENFRHQLGTHSQVWDEYYSETGHLSPQINKSTSTWINYCNCVVLNAVVYHAFLNGVDQVRSLFTEEQRRSIEWRVWTLRRMYRDELFAEGAAYSHYFGERLTEKPPYRVSLEHIAAMLDKR